MSLYSLICKTTKSPPPPPPARHSLIVHLRDVVTFSQTPSHLNLNVSIAPDLAFFPLIYELHLMHSPITLLRAHFIYATVLTPLFSIGRILHSKREFFCFKGEELQNEMSSHAENPASHPTGANHLILKQLYHC